MMRQVGRSKALDLILKSKRLTAKEAYEIGLVDQVVGKEELEAKVLELAQFLAERPPLAVASVLRAMAAGLYQGIDSGLKAEAEGSTLVGRSKDAIEGFTAFLQKRKPSFTGE